MSVLVGRALAAPAPLRRGRILTAFFLAAPAAALANRPLDGLGRREHILVNDVIALRIVVV